MDTLSPQIPKIPWYKTKAGIIFLTILSLIGVVGLLFLGLFGYYFWEIKTGDGGSLAAQFSTPSSDTASAQSEIGNFSSIIRPYNSTKGNPEAPITIIMFKDFECPSCQRAYPIMEKIIGKFGPSLYVVFKHFPVDSIHPNAVNASLAAACAEEQDAFWQYYDLLFQNKKLDEQSLYEYAKELGLDEKQFDLCYTTTKYGTNVGQDFDDGVEAGVRGTPTYFVNGKKYEGVLSEEIWTNILLDQIKN